VHIFQQNVRQYGYREIEHEGGKICDKSQPEKKFGGYDLIGGPYRRTQYNQGEVTGR
jgi:hypothetical protein